MDDRWYCPLPFKHVFVDSTGVSSCCIIPRQSVSLTEWPSNPNLLRIQQQTLDGEVPKECGPCRKNEQNGLQSLRLSYLSDYDYQRFDIIDIDFVDYRYSNLCNFKCRSCNPLFSHKISQEVKNNPSLQKFYGTQSTDKKMVSINQENVEWISQNLNRINRLMFTGGEPTVIPEVRQILENILDTPGNQVRVLITTNGSFTDDFWYKLIDKMPDRLHLTLSIDAVGPAAEIIRHGTDWSVIEKNLRWLAVNAESLDVNTVVTNLSIMQLKPLLRLCREMQKQSIAPNGRHGSQGLQHQIHISQEPHLSAINWPEEQKPKITNYLSGCLDMDLDDEQKNTIQQLIKMITKSKFNPGFWTISQDFHAQLDSIRNENHLDLLP